MKGITYRLLLSLALILVFLCSGLIHVSANETSNGEVGQQWWWSKDKDSDNPNPQQEDIPDPKGGPERTERMRQPVSNIVLQQRYPETVVLQGARDQNKVALTFDDGPDPRFTEQVLDVLNEYGIKATFFQMGVRAEAYPDITKRIIEEGHIIGNHTYWHPNLVEEGDLATLEREVIQSEEALQGLIGYRTKLFRAPYGFLTNELVEKLADMDYTVVGWSVDSLDWREAPPEDIAYTVLSNVQLGAIILMHDGAEWDGDRTGTIEALRQIIPNLQEQGIEFTTVPDLLDIPYQK